MPRKLQTLKNVSASNFDLNWAKMPQKLSKCWKSFLERRQWKEQVLNGFLSVKVVWFLFKMPNAQDVREQAEQMKMWIRWSYSEK